MAVSDIPRVLLLLDQGKSMEALELSSKLIAEMPTHVTSYVVHARANESQGQYHNAFVSWRHALDLMPNSPQILKGLLRTADKLSRPEPSGSDDFQFMGWTEDENQINKSRYRFAPVDAVDPQLLADPLVTDAVEETSGDSAATDDSNEVPVFLDTDLPDSDGIYELDASGDDSELMHVSIDEVQEETIVVTSGEAPNFRDELDANQETAVTALADAYQTELSGVDYGVFSDDARASNTSDDARASNTSDDARASNTSDAVNRDAAEKETSPSESATSSPVAVAQAAASGRQNTPSPIADLDSLIVELESARIVPRADDDPAPAPNLESDVEGMVSETLARIYAAQTQYAESARIYDKLASLHPVREKEFQAKSAEMRSRIS